MTSCCIVRGNYVLNQSFSMLLRFPSRPMRNSEPCGGVGGIPDTLVTDAKPEMWRTLLAVIE